MKEKDDQFFKSIMKKSKHEMPFPDFENEVMEQIEKKQSYEKSLSLNLVLSWIIYVAEVIAGITIFLLLPKTIISIGEINLEYFSIIIQAFLVLIILIQFESLYTFSKRLKVNKFF